MKNIEWCKFFFWETSPYLSTTPQNSCWSSMCERFEVRSKYGVGHWLRQKGLEGIIIGTLESKLLIFSTNLEVVWAFQPNFWLLDFLGNSLSFTIGWDGKYMLQWVGMKAFYQICELTAETFKLFFGNVRKKLLLSRNVLELSQHGL